MYVQDKQRRHLVLFSLRMFRGGMPSIRLLDSWRMFRGGIFDIEYRWLLRFRTPPGSQYIRSRQSFAPLVRWDIAYIRLLHSRQMFLLHIICNPFSLSYVSLRRGKVSTW